MLGGCLVPPSGRAASVVAEACAALAISGEGSGGVLLIAALIVAPMMPDIGVGAAS